MTRLADRLPEFPWDRLAPYAEIARAHPGGVVDLSVGTPVDPDARRGAGRAGGRVGLRRATRSTAGTPALREASVRWMARTLRRLGSTRRTSSRPIGSKELVALAADAAGARRRRPVVVPELAYPTYDVGARVARRRGRRRTRRPALWARPVSLVWVNSPSNPTGRVLPVEHLRKVVAWARERGAVVVTDECYLELAVDATAGLGAATRGSAAARIDGILAVHSLSKRSNLAGYRVRDRARRPVAGRLAARGAQARRDDGAGADAGRGGRGPRRRRARGRAARALRAAAATTCSRRCSTPGSPSSTPRPASTCGPRAASRAGTPWRGWPSAGSWWLRATSTARPAPGTCAWPSPPPTNGSPLAVHRLAG